MDYGFQAPFVYDDTYLIGHSHTRDPKSVKVSDVKNCMAFFKQLKNSKHPDEYLKAKAAYAYEKDKELIHEIRNEKCVIL